MFRAWSELHVHSPDLIHVYEGTWTFMRTGLTSRGGLEAEESASGGMYMPGEASRHTRRGQPWRHWQPPRCKQGANSGEVKLLTAGPWCKRPFGSAGNGKGNPSWVPSYKKIPHSRPSGPWLLIVDDEEGDPPLDLLAANLFFHSWFQPAMRDFRR